MKQLAKDQIFHRHYHVFSVKNGFFLLYLVDAFIGINPSPAHEVRDHDLLVMPRRASFTLAAGKDSSISAGRPSS
jgi:hypothetical protein